MKKTACIFLVITLVFTFFTACTKADTSLWQANETFRDIVVCQYGDTISADFASSCNIKVSLENYEDFVKYIGELKDAGFEYLQNGDIPENYNLSGGTASWRCTNGDIYLMLIYSETGSTSYESFGCNLQIYGYNEKPSTW